MITVVARWDSTQLTPETEWNMWRQLKGAYMVDRFVFVPVLDEMRGYPIDQYDSMQEALTSTAGERVFLEPLGTKRMAELPADDIVIVVGNTAESNVKHARTDEMYRINCEGTTDHNHLYGINAAAVALAIRYGQ